MFGVIFMMLAFGFWTIGRNHIALACAFVALVLLVLETKTYEAH